MWFKTNLQTFNAASKVIGCDPSYGRNEWMDGCVVCICVRHIQWCDFSMRRKHSWTSVLSVIDKWKKTSFHASQICEALYYVEVGFFYAHFWKSFYHKWVLNFVESFLCICWDYHMVFIFQFVNMAYHIDWFAYIEESLHP